MRLGVCSAFTQQTFSEGQLWARPCSCWWGGGTHGHGQHRQESCPAGAHLAAKETAEEVKERAWHVGCMGGGLGQGWEGGPQSTTAQRPGWGALTAPGGFRDTANVPRQWWTPLVDSEELCRDTPTPPLPPVPRAWSRTASPARPPPCWQGVSWGRGSFCPLVGLVWGRARTPGWSFGQKTQGRDIFILNCKHLLQEYKTGSCGVCFFKGRLAQLRKGTGLFTKTPSFMSL